MGRKASPATLRRALLAGTSLLALSLSSVPALAACYPAPPAVVGTTGVCLSWGSGNLAVTNTGTISGAGTGLSIFGSNPTGTLTNDGSISGSSYGIFNSGGLAGTLTNEFDGTISGGTYGIYNGGTTSNPTSGTIGTLTNSGIISGNINGIYSTGTIGALTNESGGTISGNTTAGINNNTGGAGGGTIGTLTNSGTISGGSYGIYSQGSIGTLANESGGTISSGGSGVNNSGTIGTLTNSGAISGGGFGIANTASGIITTLTNSGTISSASWSGIFNNGTIGALTNSGTIAGTIGIFNMAGTTTGNTTAGMIGTLTNNGVISGNTYGIHNASMIGTLTNDGTISGGTYGIYNGGTGNHPTSGTIGTLTNDGIISGGTYGIYNGGTSNHPSSGTIGALTNSGTIAGPIAIYNGNTSTLGPIVNSGLIAGNIVNTATQSLTIDGGAGTIFGTLTGSTGSIGSANEGTITSTAANLVFGSGNVLLNDLINVGGNSVVNNGAAIKVVNPVSITGAYQQTGGGFLAEAASATSYGYLGVSGNASVANSSIVIKGSGLPDGSSFTIVRSGATGSYTGDTVSVIGTNLAATLQPVGNNLVVTLGSLGSSSSSPNTFAAIGASAGGVAAALGPVLDEINGSSAPAAVAFQNAVLVPLALLPASQQGQAIKELAPVQNTFQAVDNSVTTVLDAIEQHQQTAMASSPETGKAAGSDTRNNTLWAQMLGGAAHRDSNAEAVGYNSNDFGIAAGADHLFTPELLGGVALSWLRAWSNGIDSASGQSATLDNYQLTFYGTYRHGRAFIDGQLGAGWNHFDQSRGIAFLGQTASASYDGQQYLAGAQAGYDFPIAGPGDPTVTPFFGLRWLQADDDSYTESGAGAADLSVGRQTINNVTQELGVKAGWRLGTALGIVEPELTAAWLHDYTHGPIPTSGIIGGQTFATTTPSIAADGARIGVAATLAANDRLSFRAEYDGELRDGYQSHTGLIKTVWQF